MDRRLLVSQAFWKRISKETDAEQRCLIIDIAMHLLSSNTMNTRIPHVVLAKLMEPYFAVESPKFLFDIGVCIQSAELGIYDFTPLFDELIHGNEARNAQKYHLDLLPKELRESKKFTEAWCKWYTFMVTTKGNYNTLTAEMQIKRMLEMGHDRAIRAMEYSIAGNYTQLYEQRTQKGGGDRVSTVKGAVV